MGGGCRKGLVPGSPPLWHCLCSYTPLDRRVTKEGGIGGYTAALPWRKQETLSWAKTVLSVQLNVKSLNVSQVEIQNKMKFVEMMFPSDIHALFLQKQKSKLAQTPTISETVALSDFNKAR